MAALVDFSEELASDFHIVPTRIFAKILTINDDAGKHGVLIPSEAYGFFPELPIADPSENATTLIPGIDIASKQEKPLGWKYYQRYPERRITRLNSDFNDRELGLRLAIFARATKQDGRHVYLTKVLLENRDHQFWPTFKALFDGIAPDPGVFVQIPLASPSFRKDQPLTDLLELYDKISARGWIDSLRSGDTGIGYTFETLAGIKENNEQTADFKGIEIKCKLLKSDKQRASGKINLFQMGPNWSDKRKMLERLRAIGSLGTDGLYSCYSQITPAANNLGLKLIVPSLPVSIDLLKDDKKIGHWNKDKLAKRLAMKHSRAVFIKADSRKHKDIIQYQYKELVYCEKPDIEQFIDMIERKRIVFEFAMHERPPGKVRNHGYPWRLVDEKQLETLFAYQIKLRG